MRRKNERKSKASPEKKSEPAATRRSHRRRRHQSSSPEPEETNQSDSENNAETPPKLEAMVTKKPEGSNSNSEEEKLEERPVWQVKSSEPPAGGEIQKLKICLARPSSTPERSDKSPRRHRKHRGNASLSQTDEDSCEEKTKAKSKKSHVESSTESKVGRVSEDHNSSDSQQVSSTDIDENSKTNEKEEKQGEFIEEQVGTSQDVASSERYNDPESTEPDNPDQSSIEEPVKVNGEEEITSEVKQVLEENESDKSCTPEPERSNTPEKEKSNTPEPERSSTPKGRKERSSTPEVRSTTPEIRKERSCTPEVPNGRSKSTKLTKERSNTPESRKDKSSSPEPPKPTSTQDLEESDERSNTPEPIVVKSKAKVAEVSTNIDCKKNNEMQVEETVVEEPKKITSQISTQPKETIAREASPARPSTVSAVPTPVQCSDIEPTYVTEESTYVADPARKKIRLKDTVKDFLTPQNLLTSDYIQEILPEFKWLEANELRLEEEARPDPEDRKAKKKPFEDKKVTIQKEFIATPPTASNPMLANRKISIVGEETNNTLNRPPSPAKNEPTPVLYIKNLVRPFTLNQLKELLSRTGTIRENGFWINKIKSECYVHYESLEQSIETRNALHGVHWPVANGRRLNVDFGTEEAMDKAQAPTEVKKEIKPELPPKEVKPKEEAVDWREERERERIRREQRGVREWDVGKQGQEKSHSPSPPKRRHQSPPSKHVSPERKSRKKEEVPSKLLDDLFRKTKATPCIYWLPLSAEMIVVKEEQRRKHMAEHERRLAELRRVERMRRPSGRGRENRGRYD